jgi:molecular chaperone GrpE
MPDEMLDAKTCCQGAGHAGGAQTSAGRAGIDAERAETSAGQAEADAGRIEAGAGRVEAGACSSQGCEGATKGNGCGDTSSNDELDAEALAQRLKNAEREIEEINNRYLLALADCDNIKKRARAEREALRSTVICEFVGSLLPVIDNLDRAIESGESGDPQAMVDGLKMIRSQIHAVLEAEGVRCIEAVGAQFDPNKHDAVMAVELEGHADNEIVEELQRGYEAGGRVIRPSMVKVNRARD